MHAPGAGVRPYTPKHLVDTVLLHHGALKGEYKHVTVLFADLQDSTALAQAVGPEVLHELLDGMFALMLDAVHGVEGTVNQFTGDGIMALFGAPMAHEDHAVRALYAALGIQRAFAAYATQVHCRHGITMALRLGLHTGPVVVGTIGNDLRMDYTAQGFTTHLANRLQKLAPAGAIYLSEAVRQQARELFDFKDLGLFALRGMAEPVRVYACTGGGQGTSRLATSLRRGWSVFLGRERELASLRTLWARACGGQGQVVWLVGEAGVGKSRLVYEFRRTLGVITTLEVQSLPFGRSMPYHAFVPLVRTLLGEPLAPEPTRQQIRSQLAALDPALAENEPLLTDMLGLPIDTGQLPRWSPEEQKQRTQHTCLQVIVRLAAGQPICLLVEDVQWLDSGSQELLELLIASLGQRSILLLATARPEGRCIGRERAYVHELLLTPLDEDDTEAFVHHWCSPHRASAALKTLTRERTEGNPFFIEEMLRALQEHGLLTLQDGQYEVCKHKEVAIPASVQGVLAARIDRLSPNLKEVLQVGAVIGREFPLRLLETALERVDLQAQLEALRCLGLIYAKAAQPEPTYCFKHVLTRDVAYASVLQQVKKRLHGRIAQALEARYPERLDEYAHHFGLAEHWSKAVQYSRLAAAKAHRLSQCQEAVNLYTQAQRYLAHLPEERSRQEALLDLQLAMIWPLRNLGQPDAMLQVCREAEALAQTLADRVRLGKAYLGSGNSYAYKGAFTHAETSYQRALQQLVGTGEEGLVAFTRYGLAVAYQAQGRWKHAEAFFVESIRAQEAQHTETQYPEWEVGVLPYAYSCVTLAYNVALQGRIQEAKTLLHKRYTPAVQRAANLFTKAYCVVWHSRLAALLGEDVGALGRAQEVLALTAEVEAPSFRFLGYLAQGTALLAVERYEAARAACERALQVIAGTSHGDGLGLAYFTLAWASLALGDRAAAERYYQAGQRQTARFALLRAQLLATAETPEVAQAKTLFAQSLQADEAAGAVVLAAHTRFYLAQLLARQGDHEGAGTLLTMLYRQFRHWGMLVWQSKCERALAALPPAARPGVSTASTPPCIGVPRDPPPGRIKGCMRYFMRV
jgi:class 3 adenylate cyclase/tetratricopeptide (TPR) repeat protein